MIMKFSKSDKNYDGIEYSSIWNLYYLIESSTKYPMLNIQIQYAIVVLDLFYFRWLRSGLESDIRW